MARLLSLLVVALAIATITLVSASDFSGQLTVSPNTCCSLSGGNQLAFSSALHSEVTLLGQPTATTSNGISSGQVTMLTRNVDNTMDALTLISSDGNSYDFFGQSVAISVADGVVVVGAPLVDSPTHIDCGAINVFDIVGGTLSARFPIFANAANDNEYFGASLALAFPYLAVSAPGASSQQGKIEIHQHNGINFVYLYTLTPNAPVGLDGFGSVMSMAVISNQWQLVVRSGSTIQHFAGDQNSGAYVADVAGGSVKNDNFGASISVSSSGSLAIGAPLYDKSSLSNVGGVYTYTFVGNNWVQDAVVLSPADGATNDNFGASVAVTQSTLSVGSPFNDAAGLADSGAVYVYAKNSTGWFPRAKTVSSNAHAGDHFGMAAGADGVYSVGAGWTATNVYVDGTSFAPVPLFIQAIKIQQTTAGQPLTVAVTVLGGQGPITLSATSNQNGFIPTASITFSGTGSTQTAHFVSVAAGTATINVTASDGAQTTWSTFKIRVNSPLTISAIPNVQTYVSNTSFPPLQITVGGGTGTLTLSALSSDESVYPANLALFSPASSPTSLIRLLTLRFPVAFGECNLTVVLTDSVGASTSQTFHLSLDLLPTFTDVVSSIGTSMTAPARPFNITVSGSKPPLVLTVVSSSAPSYSVNNLAVGPGTIAGIRTLTIAPPTQTVTTTITLRLTDALNMTTETTFTLVVNEAPALVSATTLRELYLSDSVSYGVSITGGTAPFTVTATPVDNSFITSTSVTGSGTTRTIQLFSSTKDGNTNVNVALVDAAGATISALTPVSIYILPSLDIISTQETTVQQGIPFTVSVQGTRAPFTLTSISLTPSIVPTVTFSPVSGAGGSRGGTIVAPIAAGAGLVTVVVTDNGGRNATRPLPVTVNVRPTIVPQFVNLKAFAGEGGNFSVTVGGGTRTLTVTAATSASSVVAGSGLLVLTQSATTRVVLYNTSASGLTNLTVTVNDSVGAVTTVVVPLTAYVDQCKASPCVNGECHRFFGDYNCTCSGTYVGRNCDVESSKITKELAVIVGASIAGFLLLLFVFFGFYCKWFTKCCCPTTPQYVTNPPPAKMDSTTSAQA